MIARAFYSTRNGIVTQRKGTNMSTESREQDAVLREPNNDSELSSGGSLRDKIAALIIEGELIQARTLGDRIDVSRESADSIIALIRERLLADDAVEAMLTEQAKTWFAPLVLADRGVINPAMVKNGRDIMTVVLDRALGGE